MENNFCLRLHTFASVQSHYPLINSCLCILNRIHFTATLCKANHSNFVWFWCAAVRHDLERENQIEKKYEYNMSIGMNVNANANNNLPGRPQKVSSVWKCLRTDSASSSLLICMEEMEKRWKCISIWITCIGREAVHANTNNTRTWIRRSFCDICRHRSSSSCTPPSCHLKIPRRLSVFVFVSEAVKSF